MSPTEQHPITPPPELVQQWLNEVDEGSIFGEHLANRAAQWGADQELQACCDHIRDCQWGFVDRPDGTKIHRAVDLYQSRRPQPPSLKEQALAKTTAILNDPSRALLVEVRETLELNLRVLEALPYDIQPTS